MFIIIIVIVIVIVILAPHGPRLPGTPPTKTNNIDLNTNIQYQERKKHEAVTKIRKLQNKKNPRTPPDMRLALETLSCMVRPVLGWCRLGGARHGRFPKFHRVFLGRDPGTLKSDIVSKKHPQ